MMLEEQIKRFNIINFLYTVGRALPQSILTIILIGKGLELSEILLIQVGYMITTLLFEFPSGILADKISQQKVFFLSIVALNVSYLMVFFSTSLLFLFISWMVYGLSAALHSGTMDVYFFKKLEQQGKGSDAFFVKTKNIVLIATVTGSLVGASLYQIIGVRLYFLSVILFTISSIQFYYFFLRRSNNIPIITKNVRDKQIIENLKSMYSNKSIQIIFVLLIITQFAVQPFFQLWQMILVDLRISPIYFGVIFVGFQLMNIFSNHFFSYLIRKTNSLNILYISLMVLFFIGGVLRLAGGGSSVYVVLMLLFTPVPLYIYSNQLEISLVKAVPEAYMSSFISSIGTASSFTSIIAVAIISQLAKYQVSSTILSSSYMLFSAISVSIVFFCRGILFGCEKHANGINSKVELSSFSLVSDTKYSETKD